MATEIIVPTLGESVTEATVAKWFKAEGDAVAVDEPILELETDKVTLEVNASTAGTLSEISAKEGDNVEVGALLGLIGEGGAAPAKKPEAATPAAPAEKEKPAEAVPAATTIEGDDKDKLSPAVRKLVDENNLDASQIKGTGKDGRLTKGDVLLFMKDGGAAAAPAAALAAKPAAPSAPRADDSREERVKMTRLRKRIAERLKEAQNTAAMLTTFNEIDIGGPVNQRHDFTRAHTLSQHG